MSADNDNCRPEWWLLGVLLIINLAAKAGFIGINTGEYTDGILQLTVFENRAGLYPPLYGMLAQMISALGIDIEMAGRLISVVAGAFCVLPVYWLGLRLGGPAAARLAALFYTVSPMPWRWSVRVMTDSTYLLFSTLALYFLMVVWSQIRQARPGDTPRADLSVKLGIAAIFGALAVLTRYQGILLVPLIGWVFAAFIVRYRRLPLVAILLGLTWVALPVWMQINGFVHQDQFSARTGQTFLSTLSAWWNTFESFLLISPYYMGYPVMIAAVCALFILRRSFGNSFVFTASWLWGAYGLMLLALHAAFGSFQYRYMMPMLPVVVALAGVGFANLENRFKQRRWVFSGVMMISLVYLAMFSLAVLVFQRDAFGDQRQAARYIKDNVSAKTPVYANERYGDFTSLGSVKLSFWSGRKVSLIPSETDMEPGSILVLGTAYGGDSAVSEIMGALSQKYELRPLTQQPFRSSILPLMDDIMVNPMFNQNPMGWVMRYVPQPFATQVFSVYPRQAGTGGL